MNTRFESRFPDPAALLFQPPLAFPEPCFVLEQRSSDRHPTDAPHVPEGPHEFNRTAPDDESCWDVFLPDDDELDPLPEPGDFWLDQR